MAKSVTPTSRRYSPCRAALHTDVRTAMARSCHSCGVRAARGGPCRRRGSTGTPHVSPGSLEPDPEPLPGGAPGEGAGSWGPSGGPASQGSRYKATEVAGRRTPQVTTHSTAWRASWRQRRAAHPEGQTDDVGGEGRREGPSTWQGWVQQPLGGPGEAVVSQGLTAPPARVSGDHHHNSDYFGSFPLPPQTSRDVAL